MHDRQAWHGRGGAGRRGPHVRPERARRGLSRAHRRPRHSLRGRRRHRPAASRARPRASRRTSSNPSWCRTAPAPAARIGVAYVARSAPDGYTLLFVPALAYSVLPLMQSNVGYTDKSFAPICQTFENQMALIVRPDSPFKTARDIVEAARAKDGCHYAATAVGTITHLAGGGARRYGQGQAQPRPVPRRRRSDGPVDRRACRFCQRDARFGCGGRALGAGDRNLRRRAQPLAAGRAHDQGAGLRRRADELRRAVCAGWRAGRRAGQARHRLQVRGGAAGLRQTSPSSSTRARATTRTPRPSPSGSTPT